MQTWHFLMQVGTARELSETEVRSRAVGYVNPPELHMELGSFVPQAAPGTRTAGFDPTSGCYVISPDRGRVRFTIDGKRREMGLGSFPDVGLAEARDKATGHRKQAKAGIDPIEARQTEPEKTPTFTTCAARYIQIGRASGRESV